MTPSRWRNNTGAEKAQYLCLGDLEKSVGRLLDKTSVPKIRFGLARYVTGIGEMAEILPIWGGNEQRVQGRGGVSALVPNSA